MILVLFKTMQAFSLCAIIVLMVLTPSLLFLISFGQFNDYGLKRSNSFDHFKLRSSALQLAAAGMRRKNLMVMEVDVYKVGIYLSPTKDKDASTSFGKGNLVRIYHHIKNDKPGVISCCVSIKLHLLISPISCKQLNRKRIFFILFKALVGFLHLFDFI